MVVWGVKGAQASLSRQRGWCCLARCSLPGPRPGHHGDDDDDDDDHTEVSRLCVWCVRLSVQVITLQVVAGGRLTVAWGCLVRWCFEDSLQWKISLVFSIEKEVLNCVLLILCSLRWQFLRIKRLCAQSSEGYKENFTLREELVKAPFTIHLRWNSDDF